MRLVLLRNNDNRLGALLLLGNLQSNLLAELLVSSVMEFSAASVAFGDMHAFSAKPVRSFLLLRVYEARILVSKSLALCCFQPALHLLSEVFNDTPALSGDVL